MPKPCTSSNASPDMKELSHWGILLSMVAVGALTTLCGWRRETRTLDFGHDISVAATARLKHMREGVLLRRNLGVKLGLAVNGLRRRAPVVMIKFSVIRVK